MAKYDVCPSCGAKLPEALVKDINSRSQPEGCPSSGFGPKTKATLARTHEEQRKEEALFEIVYGSTKDYFDRIAGSRKRSFSNSSFKKFNKIED